MPASASRVARELVSCARPGQTLYTIYLFLFIACVFYSAWLSCVLNFGESGLLEKEPTAPAEQAHTTRRQ